MINTKVNYFLCTFFICIGLQSHISFSQNYSDSAQYVKFNSIASRFARQGNTDSALYYRKTAKGFAKQPLQEAKVNLAIAWDYFDKRQFDSASFQVAYNFEKPLSFFSSHELIRELALSYHFIKNIYNYRGDYDNAEISLLKVIDLIEKESIDESVLIATYMDLGSNYFRISDYDKAMTWGKKSLIAAQNSPLPQAKTLEIRSYLLLGEIHWKKNELEKSSDHFKYVLSSISNMPDADERDYLLACMSLGGVFFDNAVYDSAYKYFGKAVNQLKVLEQSNYYKSLVPYYNINVLNSIAAIYNQREEYYKVNEVLKESIAIANTYYGKENAETAVLLSSLANNQINLGNYENAKSLLQKVIQIRRSAFGEKNSELSAAFNLMGQLHWKRDLPTLAAVYFDSALMSNKKITFLDQEIYSSGRCWQSYSGILKILLSGETLNRKNQIDSIHLLLQKQLRYGHGNSDSKLIESDIIEAQELLYNFYTEEYLKTSDHATATKLWEIAESGKARKLSSKINSDSRKYELIPQKLLARETKLRKEIENYLSSVDDQKIKTDSLLFLANRQYDEFMDSIELNYPKYFALKYPGLEKNIDEVINELSEGHAIISYFGGRSTIHAMLVTKDTIMLKNIDKKSLTKLIDDFHSGLPANEIQSTGKAIKSMVLPSSLHNLDIEKLEIIPDGIIWHVNFAILPEFVKEVDNPRNNYMGNHKDLIYQYAYHYKGLNNKYTPNNNNKILAYSFEKEQSDDDISSYLKFRDLSNDAMEGVIPGTSEEIRQIASIFDGDYYYANMASKSSFIENCGDYKILHLAVHGIADDKRPDFSRLKFYGQEQNYLHAFEIYNLKLNAELAILSACESGTGQVKNGEGVMSLGRAFSIAGAKSMVLSKWEISDITAPVIMKYFYSALADGKRKSEALRIAKNQFLENDADNITSAPYYWASFYVMGDDSPIEFNQPWHQSYWFFSIMILLTIITAGFTYHRKAKRATT